MYLCTYISKVFIHSIGSISLETPINRTKLTRRSFNGSWVLLSVYGHFHQSVIPRLII